MSGGKAEARSKSDDAVVGTGGYGFEGGVDSGPGGGAGGAGGGNGRYRNCNRQLIKWVGYCSKHNLRYRS